MTAAQTWLEEIGLSHLVEWSEEKLTGYEYATGRALPIEGTVRTAIVQPWLEACCYCAHVREDDITKRDTRASWVGFIALLQQDYDTREAIDSFARVSDVPIKTGEFVRPMFEAYLEKIQKAWLIKRVERQQTLRHRRMTGQTSKGTYRPSDSTFHKEAFPWRRVDPRSKPMQIDRRTDASSTPSGSAKKRPKP